MNSGSSQLQSEEIHDVRRPEAHYRAYTTIVVFFVLISRCFDACVDKCVLYSLLIYKKALYTAVFAVPKARDPSIVALSVKDALGRRSIKSSLKQLLQMGDQISILYTVSAAISKCHTHASATPFSGARPRLSSYYIFHPNQSFVDGMQLQAHT